MTRRRKVRWATAAGLLTLSLLACSGEALAQQVQGWRKGKGYGWIWGKGDEIGALNALTPGKVVRAISLVREGKVYDLGVRFDRTSFMWPGHSPTEVIAFRTPEGLKRQQDLPAYQPGANPTGVAWRSAALFINDNVGTQIDSLSHIAVGDDNHWYNGFREAEWGGNWGPRKASADRIPPIVTRGVLIDVAGHRGLQALPSNYSISPKELQEALSAQRVEIEPGDAVFIRTGTLRYWGETGADRAKLAEHDSAGISLEAAKWLVEQKGAVLIGADNSGLETLAWRQGEFYPAHIFLLVEQGVYIGEFHYLEQLAREKVYEFLYICTTNKIKGTSAGFTLRPVAIR
ncbi:MAG: cyclase family protein [Candidatus Methylomirabilis oxyfera]|nr:cyclase family protein [Candidatus Methylomirabilis oxyfera]